MEYQTWTLDRYARLSSAVANPGVTSADGWEHFDNKADHLEMTITSSNHLLLHQGKKQMESISLANTSSDVKGMSKGDSLLIVYKVGDQSRRFRVKFASTSGVKGDACCRACVERLSKHIQIKIPDEKLSQQVPGIVSSKPGDGPTLVGDVTLGQLASAIGSKTLKLPDVYARLQNGTDVDLETLIKLCLTDPSFPAFVGKVEKELEKIKNESC